MKKSIKSFFNSGPRLSPKDLAVFTRQFSVLLDSGLSLRTIFSVLQDQTVNLKLKMVIESLSYAVLENGMTLSAALSRHRDVFSPVYISTVKSGESSGFLSKSMKLLAEDLQKDVKLINQYISALVYPAITLTGSFLAIILVLKFIFPSFAPLFSSFNVELPLPTKMLMLFNAVLSNWWLDALVLFGIFFLLTWINYYFLKTKYGDTLKNYVLMKIPVVNKLFIKSMLCRFCKMFALLHLNGCPLLFSLQLLKNVVGNTRYEEEMEKVITDVSDGETLATAFKRRTSFPVLLISMIFAGEETGEMSKTLINVANYYELEVENYLGVINALIEPVIILFLGVVIAFILMAVMLPIYAMMGQFGNV